MSIADRHVDPPKALDYGKRTPGQVRGFCVHMAEGNNVAAYLSRNPARGVSVNYTVEQAGAIVSMVPELHIAGSINPKTVRRDDDKNGYYGASHAKAALGGLWLNPNRGVIAIEVAGKAVDGPNAKQVDALVALFKDCRRRYPGLVPLGHRDFQSVKRCPGSTVAIKRMYRLMGGHGTDYSATKPAPPPEPPVEQPEVDRLRAAVADLTAEVADLRGTIAAMVALGAEQLSMT